MKNLKESEEILARFGVSRVEYEAMICPNYEIPLGPREMASYTVLENNCCSGECKIDAFSADDYLTAIKGMIAKGWLCLQEETPQIHQKATESGIPQEEHYPIKPGSVVFTKTGYLLHRQLRQELYGLQFVQEADAFATVDRENCEIHFYAATKALCENWIRKISQVSLKFNELTTYVDLPADVISAEAPVPIGSWMPSPYITLSNGYHALVRYRKQEPIVFNEPEFQLESEICSFQPVALHGRIAGKSFSFYDNAFWDCPGDAEMDDSCAEYHWDFTIDDPPGIITPTKAHLSGETYTGGFGTRNILFSVEESYSEPRKATLSVEAAKQIVVDCATKYLQQIKNKG
jgi:hypothetical protein